MLARTANRVPGVLGRVDRNTAKSEVHSLEPRKSFSDHAVERMLFLRNPDHARDMVGSQSGVAKSPEFVTDCITNAIRVLSFAFEKTDQMAVAERVRKLGARGTDLAAYLVNENGWTAALSKPLGNVEGRNEEGRRQSGRDQESQVRVWVVARRHAHLAVFPWARPRGALGSDGSQPLRQFTVGELLLAVQSDRHSA
ncbi:MAG: hypothetical protein JW809_05120 [Pirellulales bacterium]|nr:hypothetical protein [Pirellulales bacterium]